LRPRALRHYENLALYFFGFALCLIPLTFVASALDAGVALVLRLVTLRRACFSISAPAARPGDTIEARAEVIPRWSRPVAVEARLTCTMFDHRAHELFSSTRTMRPTSPGSHQYAVNVVLPAYALRTGQVGDKAHPISERAHRMLVVWTVDFAVRSANRGILLRRKSRPLDVPSGRRPKTHLRRMSLLAVDTFTATRNDMLFNWLVHLAASDGPIAGDERAYLVELLTEMEGMTDAEVAADRIEWDLQRRLVIDDLFLKRYVPIDARLEFYRALFTLALVDGPVSQPERAFLSAALKALGITSAQTEPIEKDATGARVD
jgi:hypothetical protein